MLQLQFSSCKEDVFEFVGRVSTFVHDYEPDLDIRPELVSSSDSGCVVCFTVNATWCWHKSKTFIDTLKHIASNNSLYVEVVGVLFY